MLQSGWRRESDFLQNYFKSEPLGQPFHRENFNGYLYCVLLPFNRISHWMPQPSLNHLASWRLSQDLVPGTCLYEHLTCCPLNPNHSNKLKHMFIQIHTYNMYVCLVSACTVCMWVCGYYPRILSLSLSLCLYIYLSINLSIYLPIYRSIYLSICLSFCLSI